MKHVQFSTIAAMLAVTTSAWAAGIEPYPESELGPEISTKTRSEVISEVQEAVRQGKLTIGEDDFPRITLEPQTGDMATAKLNDAVLRTRVRAETNEAGRLGLLSVGDPTIPIATAEQEESIAEAGRIAAEALVSAQVLTKPTAK